MKMLLLTFAALWTASAAAGASEPKFGGLVARKDYDVASSWAAKKFCGREFWPMFYPKAQSVQRPAFGKVDPGWDLDIFRESVIEFNTGWGRWLGTRFRRDHRTREIVTNGLFRADYSLKDYLDEPTWKTIGDAGGFDRPFFLHFLDARPSFLLEQHYPHNDRAGFERWRAKHPGFIGCITLSEFDSEFTDYTMRLKREMPDDVRAILTEGYPDTSTPSGFYEFAKESFRRQRELHFGSADIWTLHSSCWTLSHVMADVGAKGFFYEATGQEFANWRMAAAYCRGASRQWNIPFGWYVANWYTGYVRGKYDKVTQGSNLWSGKATEWLKGGAFQDWRGLSRSMLDRQNAYGWLNGASFLQVEDWIRLYCEPAGEDGTRCRPHQVAVDFDNLYRLSKSVDRGVVYAPCAILASVCEKIGPSALSNAADKHNLNAFYFSLVPVNSQDIPQRSLKKVGNQGCLFNSPFGDCFDVLAPDSHQTKADLVRALGAYKVAFLAGGYRKEDFQTEALVDYVRQGGTLVISSDRLADGLFPSAMAGVDFTAATKASGKALVDAATGAKTALSAPYKWAVAKPGAAAKVLLADELGTPAVYANDCGRGRVVTVACWRMMPAEYCDDFERVNTVTRDGDVRWRVVTECFSGKRQFEVIRTLLAKAQDETMPVKVDGDVHWGVNRTRDGWLVWLMNNKGVVHYANEPEEFDANATAEVRLTFKPTGTTGAATVEPGAWKLVAIDSSGAFRTLR